MSQTKKRSLKEAVLSTFIGMAVTFTVGPLFYYACDMQISWKQNLGLTTLFTLLSILRGYIIRRIFNKNDK